MASDRTDIAIFVETYEASGEGLRVAVKDTIDMVGKVTAAGCRALAGAKRAAANAELVDRLLDGGCQVVGRTNMHELAYGVTGLNLWSGTPTNPKYPALIPGGSSSGSAAAVAAGLVDFAIGTDTGGSIRVPAACCAIFGLKPTFGRVSRKGLIPRHSTLDCAGPFARDIDMIETAMHLLVPDWHSTRKTGKATVAYYSAPCDPAIEELVRHAASRCFEICEAELSDFEAAMDAGMKIIARETWDAVGHLTETGLVGADVHDRLLKSKTVSDMQIAEAEDIRKVFTAQVDRVLETVDAILLPAMPCLPPSLLEASDSQAAIPITTNCRPFNLSGHPAIVVPIGEIDGRPVSMQLVGRRGEDEALCALARNVTPFQKGERS